jgi:hypothetical protein
MQPAYRAFPLQLPANNCVQSGAFSAIRACGGVGDAAVPWDAVMGHQVPRMYA